MLGLASLMMPHDPLQDDRLFTDYCDSKDNWGPLVVFRPLQDERMSAVRTLTMSALLGFLFGVPGSIFLSLMARLVHRPDAPLWVLPTALTAVYFAAASLTFVPAWNRRAARLAQSSRD